MDKNRNNEKININNNNNPNNPYYSKDTEEKLLFIRHGETFFNSDPDKTGRKTNYKYIDSKLTTKGIEQSKALQKILNKLTIEVIYISPMYRAFQTVFYALENHPDLSKIKVIVNPLVNEVASCVNDYILDIKQTKKEFNMNSKIKFDWSIFDEYVKSLKWEENFYYFDYFDCFEEKKKNEIYLELRHLYNINDLISLEQKLTELSIIRYQQDKRFESLKHLQSRFNKFFEYIKEKHKNTLGNKESKILVVTHTSFIKCATERNPYEDEDIQDYHPNAYSSKNCEIISIKL